VCNSLMNCLVVSWKKTIFADVYITKDFSIINDNNFKLLDKVFNLTKSKRGRKLKKQDIA